MTEQQVVSLVAAICTGVLLLGAWLERRRDR